MESQLPEQCRFRNVYRGEYLFLNKDIQEQYDRYNENALTYMQISAYRDKVDDILFNAINESKNENIADIPTLLKLGNKISGYNCYD